MQFARTKNKKKQTNSVPRSLPFGTGFFWQARTTLNCNHVFLCRKYSTAVTIIRTSTGQRFTATKGRRIVKRRSSPSFEIGPRRRHFAPVTARPLVRPKGDLFAPAREHTVGL